jgi:hypothetical protein
MKKNDVFFMLILLFVVKLILLPSSFADAAVLLVLLAYRPVSQFLKLQEKQKISDANNLKFESISEEISEVKKTLESIKVKEAVINSFGIKK